MAITVSLWSGREGEIKTFLEKYYNRKVLIDENAKRWIYVFDRPLDAVDMISAVMDNNDRFSISVCIQLDQCDLHPVTPENHNDLIKGIFHLYYENNDETNMKLPEN